MGARTKTEGQTLVVTVTLPIPSVKLDWEAPGLELGAGSSGLEAVLEPDQGRDVGAQPGVVQLDEEVQVEEQTPSGPDLETQ
jgi:hypothetical protein